MIKPKENQLLNTKVGNNNSFFKSLIFKRISCVCVSMCMCCEFVCVCL